jgi:hypothetical protein
MSIVKTSAGEIIKVFKTEEVKEEIKKKAEADLKDLKTELVKESVKKNN